MGDGPTWKGRLPAMNSHIYHLALRHAWEAAKEEGGPYRRSTIDTSLEDEGFIHCSYRDQVQGVADRFYRDRTDVLLLVIDNAKVEAEVRTENLFPHIYGPLPLQAVVRVEPVAQGDDGRLLVGALLD
jgi:glutathione S-transferase